MAWEWSHADDALGYAEEQLGKFSRETLLEIAEEWKTKLNDDAECDHEDKYDGEDCVPAFSAPVTENFAEENNGAPLFSDSMLANWIWEQASSWEHGRTCTNGGHELYMCPDGCHTVDLGDMPDDWSPEEY